ncbi:ATP-dependent RNA helicase vasa-like isoform X2 [Sipha flava]|uniref:RNA helicase n=1 Tax=Sipha flava TaxID=143950 RepID=A0A2S2QHJ6_9HEMI|nr:ATP-dependent RNA helicase vasa-like isoform X2 [Sipha flava]
MSESSQNIFSKHCQNDECSNNRVRGRGYLTKMIQQTHHFGNIQLLPSNIDSSKKIMDQCIYNNEVKPIRSTYIPPEPDENDESIYETGINYGINFDKFNDIEVKVSGKNVPKIVESFETCNAILMENIKKCKFMKPTPIQKYTIPIILSGKDLMAAAQTGSGKTVAFVLPILQKLLMEPHPIVKDIDHCEPQVIIMAPTRELAVQIKSVVLKLSRGTMISSLVCYGGTLVSHQKNQILKGCHILVATPGRLNEFVQHGLISFASVRIFVLDEVDRMLEIESKSDVDKILDHSSMPSVMNRQTIMVSATLPDSIQELAKFYLNRNYLFLAVGIVSSASKDIKQNFYLVNKFKKRKHLINILQQNSEGTIIFVNTKWMADFLATYLCEKNIPSTSIHGDRLQSYREEALSEFSNRKKNVLVATTVASRGLDIKYVNHVINYDMPQEIEEYIHRIGRTGRLGNTGIATSFFDIEHDYHLVEPIIKTLSSASQEIPYWLLKLGQEAKDKSVDDDQYGGTDIRIKSNKFDENEEW